MGKKRGDKQQTHGRRVDLQATPNAATNADDFLISSAACETGIHRYYSSRFAIEL
jgi:hypothetical protein